MFYKITYDDTLLCLYPLGALKILKHDNILECWSFEVSNSRPHTILHNPQFASHINLTTIVTHILSIILMSIL